MTTLPETVTASLMRERQPVPKVFITLRFRMARKNDFSFLLGPTNAGGVATADRRALLEDFEKDRAVAMMDYGDAKSEFAGMIEAHVTTDTELERALYAAKLFEHTGFPPMWSENLRAARAALINFPGPHQLTITVNPVESAIVIYAP